MLSSINISTEEVQKIAQLSRIGMTEEEIEGFRYQLSLILENFRVLENIDTSDTEPTGHSSSVSSVMREDVAGNPSDHEDILANAPQKENGFFRVKAVLEQ
jgi:aspartyl-tRNA(Asn)/glutamyl-tRNA(Gln) amidotransferase subunit C